MRLSDRLGGHLVQGHVNGIGIVSEIKKLGENYMVSISAPSELEKYLVKEGSITIDGISLTIADLPARPSGGKESATGGLVTISVIPHTWQNTTIQYKNSGSMVNIEIDILAKYVEKLLQGKDTEQKKLLSENWLKELGY
jgi:riboflavin synthase